MGLESPVNFITDLVATNPVGGDAKSDGDNHLRNIKAAVQGCFPGFSGRFARVAAKSAAYTAVLNDNSVLFDFSAAADLDLTAAATLGNGWMCAVYARGGAVAIDPSSTEQINGSSTSLSVPQGYLAMVWCTGTAFYAAVMPGSEIATVLAATLNQGLHTLWIPAGAMVPQITSGAGVGVTETTTNKVMLATLDFSATADEYAQFTIRMPKSWNEGTVTFQAVWSHGATTTNFDVVWGLQAIALSNDDALDTAWGTAQVVVDTGGTTEDLYQTSASSAITIAGSPAAEDFVAFRVYRDADNASDTLAVDARLHGVVLFYTISAGNDA